MQSKSKRKQDALEMAHIIYDIYKEVISDDKIDNGQINAESEKD